ncbi:hypothetical protein EON65_38720 [archaeon]|nr:MAG: hypothetical protein EON65_38720 [archaeon]
MSHALVHLHSESLETISLRDDVCKHQHALLHLLEHCHRVRSLRLSELGSFSKKESEGEFVQAVVQKAPGLVWLHVEHVNFSLDAMRAFVSHLPQLRSLFFLDARSPTITIEVIKLLASLPRTYKKLTFSHHKGESLREVREMVTRGLKVLQVKCGLKTWGNGRIELKAEQLVEQE